MADVVEVLDIAELAIARSEGVVPDVERDGLEAVIRRARTRHGFIGEVLVVALAGGTGSGKSSLVNAIVGEPMLETGVVRPTTQTPTAITPVGVAADLEPLLASLSVEDRMITDALDTLVLIDLPDFDSIETAHRHVVEEVLPRVDAVLWVLDPEKYADPILHRDFLRELVGYERQFVFVLNQADRLGDDVPAVLVSLGEHLRADGFVDPVVVASSAVDIEGQGASIADVEGAIERHLDAKSTALGKLAVDLRRAANAGWAAARHESEASSGERWDAALAAATFVSLGVAAFELHDRVNRPPRP